MLQGVSHQAIITFIIIHQTKTKEEGGIDQHFTLKLSNEHVFASISSPGINLFK